MANWFYKLVVNIDFFLPSQVPAGQNKMIAVPTSPFSPPICFLHQWYEKKQQLFLGGHWNSNLTAIRMAWEDGLVVGSGQAFLILVAIGDFSGWAWGLSQHIPWMSHQCSVCRWDRCSQGARCWHQCRVPLGGLHAHPVPKFTGPQKWQQMSSLQELFLWHAHWAGKSKLLSWFWIVNIWNNCLYRQHVAAKRKQTK